MFCSKCGTKAIEGAVFCQNCGAKLIQDNREGERPASVPKRESEEMSIPAVNTTSEPQILSSKPIEKSAAHVGSTVASLSEPAGTSTAPIEQAQASSLKSAGTSVPSTKPIAETAQDVNIQKDVSSIQRSDADIYSLLKENIDQCPVIKSAKQVKMGVCLSGKIYNHIVVLISGQANIRTALKFPFSILTGLPVGLLAYIVAGVTWDFMDYGSIYLEDYALLFALCPLIIGLLIAFVPYIGRREKATVKEYVQKTVEKEDISLTTAEIKPSVRFAIAAVCLLLGALVFIFGVLGVEFGGGGSDSGSNFSDEDSYHEDSYDEDSYDQDRDESTSLTQIYINEDEGFSFRYPLSWQHLSEADFAIRKEMLGGDSLILEIYSLDDLKYGESQYASYMQVQKGPVNLTFQGTVEDFQQALSASMDDVEVTGLSDIELDGISARKLSYLFNDNGQTYAVIEYYYVINDTMYMVRFYTYHGYFDKYAPVFDAIIDSYTITDVNMSGGNGIAASSDNYVSHTMYFEDDTNSRLELYPNGTFCLFVNLYEAEGTVIGRYCGTYSGYEFTVTGRTFSGFAGDDVEEFEMVLEGSTLKYYGDWIGTVNEGSLFRLYACDDESVVYNSVSAFYDDSSLPVLGYGLEWVETPIIVVDDYGNTFINGKVRNTYGANRSIVKIYFALWDVNEYQISSAVDMCYNLRNGDEWYFNAAVDKNAAYWDFSHVVVD